MTDGQIDPRIEACFNGDIPRECATCPGYGDKCCFSRDHTDGDSDCLRCIHKDECRRATLSKYATQKTYRSPAYRAPASNVVVRQPVRSQPTTPTVPSAGRTPINGEWGEVFAQVGRDSVWSAITGIFETIFHFLKNHRWMK